jgi:hypothetical protein
VGANGIDRMLSRRELRVEDPGGLVKNPETTLLANPQVPLAA